MHPTSFGARSSFYLFILPLLIPWQHSWEQPSFHVKKNACHLVGVWFMDKYWTPFLIFKGRGLAADENISATVAKLCVNILAEAVFLPAPSRDWHINEVLLKQCCLLISKAQRRWSNIPKQIATICMYLCASLPTLRGSRCALAQAWCMA